MMGWGPRSLYTSIQPPSTISCPLHTLPFSKAQLFVISKHYAASYISLPQNGLPHFFAWLMSTLLSDHLLWEALLECLLGLCWIPHFHSSNSPRLAPSEHSSCCTVLTSLAPWDDKEYRLLILTPQIPAQDLEQSRGSVNFNRIALDITMGCLETKSKVFQLTQWIR